MLEKHAPPSALPLMAVTNYHPIASDSAFGMY